MATGDVWGDAWSTSWGTSWATAAAPAHVAEGLLAQAEADCAALFLQELDTTQLATDLIGAFFPETSVGFAEDVELTDATVPGLDTAATIRALVETASYAGDRDGPRLLIKESDWTAGYTYNTTITMRTLSYTVAGVQPDGFGLVELVLEEA